MLGFCRGGDGEGEGGVEVVGGALVGGGGDREDVGGSGGGFGPGECGGGERGVVGGEAFDGDGGVGGEGGGFDLDEHMVIVSWDYFTLR